MMLGIRGHDVTYVAAVFEISAVFQLFVGGKREDLLAEAELTVDLLLGETEICDVEEACRPK